MGKLIYYVASSLDGFIAGPQGDISKFILEGEGVDKYQKDLLDFKTVIMGRNTYEFGYQFGLPPGQPAYPHMEHFIFSDSMSLDTLADSVHIEKRNIDRVKEIIKASDGPVYLCGGGQFAGWLLDHQLINELKIKLNPVVLGDGTRLFGDTKTAVKTVLTDREAYQDGLQILNYRLEYDR